MDIVGVILFAAIGRGSHSEALGFVDILMTAMPFLLALAFAWIIVAITGMSRVYLFAPTRFWIAGVLIWVLTVIGGIGFRLMAGDTATGMFVPITAVTLGVFILLPRLLLHSEAARTGRSTTESAE